MLFKDQQKMLMSSLAKPPKFFLAKNLGENECLLPAAFSPGLGWGDQVLLCKWAGAASKAWKVVQSG